MTNYLLLRDNKQSGPYTFDELKEKGLRAYDLVWVEGKSAAWRYPCEIQELSPFAPKVEEQPFDRFYKKPAQNSVDPSVPRATPNGTVAATILTGDTSSSASPGKRIIYVTLPAGRTAPLVAPAPREAKEPRKEVAIKEMEVKETELAVMTPSVGTVEDVPPRYNEEWKTSVETMPRAGRRNRSFRLGQTLMVGLTVMALLIAGIFIGLSLNKNSVGIIKHFSIGSAKDKPPVTSPSQPLAVNSTVPSTAASSAKDKPTDKDSMVSTASSKAAPASVSSSPVTSPRTSSRPKILSAGQKTLVTAPAPVDSSLQAVPAAHRETTHRADIAADKVDKDAIRDNLSNLVSIGASGYTVGTFGGISNVQLTVSNHSIYSLDLVVVEVQYIQANKKVFKTENLYFRGIAPGAALMQEAPKSSRGIKVQYKITLVNSKELGLSYSAL
jgi:hypothetical protein